MQLPQIDNYEQLFSEDIPLLDVRAPVEFGEGAFPGAINLPLLTDQERHDIGIRYKEQGQDKAVELGHELVSGDVKKQRVIDWSVFTKNHPQGALYCFRGGMRSKICQQWIYDETGVIYPRIKGGYKVMRRYLINEIDGARQHFNFYIVGGRTGSGKTLLLQQLQHKIDLEAIFYHRGSAFGKHCQPQPTQINVENQLAIHLLKHRKNHVSQLVLEDEASNIGSRCIPTEFYQFMKSAPLLVLETPLEQRIENVYEEYIHQSLAEYQSVLGHENGFNTWADNLRTSMDKIQRRLGGARYKQFRATLDDAIEKHLNQQETAHHKTWIRNLLSDYYDPMYDYQIENKSERFIYRGEQAEILNYLNQRDII